MTSTEYTSNRKYSSQSVFKDPKKYYQEKEDSKIFSKHPSYIFFNPLNNFNFNSQLSFKNIPIRERYSNIDFIKSFGDNKLFTKPFLPMKNMNGSQTFLGFPSLEHSREQSGIMSKKSNLGNENGKSLKFEVNDFLLNLVEKDDEQEKEEPKEESIFNRKIENNNNQKNNYLLIKRAKNNIIINENNNFNFKDNCQIEKNNNLKTNTTLNNNIGAKFFTNDNYGYKCSCTKTQCNRLYCECYNSGNYCIDCNCKNCKNRPPENTYSNKRPKEKVSKMKKSKEICTCTKSGCNKNYCECFKSGNKCTSSCRCIDCENTEDSEKLKNRNFHYYECCRANSIYIIRNQLFIEDVNMPNFEQREITIPGNFDKKTDKRFNKKRKRDENEISEKINVKKFKKDSSEDNILFDCGLFTENGKIILGHINMIHL